MIENETKVFFFRRQGILNLDLEPGIISFTSVQVISHELSNYLCSLRLSNVYDISSVSDGISFCYFMTRIIDFVS